MKRHTALLPRLISRLDFVATLMLVVFAVVLAAVSCGQKPANTPVPTSMVVVPTATVTPISQLTREEKILELAKGRPGYYDKTDIYLDLVGFDSGKDLPNCAFPFFGAIVATNGVVIEQHSGLAIVMGESGKERIVVPSFLVPVIPDTPPPPPPVGPDGVVSQPSITEEDLKSWVLYMALGSTLVQLDQTFPDLRVSTLVPQERAKGNFDNLLAGLSPACRELGSASSEAELFDFLLTAGLAGDTASVADIKIAPIDGRVRALSVASKGFYFDGTILPDDVGGLVFAFRIGKPEVVGIVTGANWHLGFETFNFATSFSEIRKALEK